jgi:hypothetical protein
VLVVGPVKLYFELGFAAGASVGILGVASGE